MASTEAQITQLENRRQDILDRIEALSDEDRDLPNSNSGENVNHIEKIRAWYEELKLIDERIAALETPFEITSEMSA